MSKKFRRDEVDGTNPPTVNQLAAAMIETQQNEIELLKRKVGKLTEAIELAMNETPIHEYCYDILELALKNYRSKE